MNNKLLMLYTQQLQVCLQHEFGDLYVQKEIGTLKSKRIERKQLSFVLKLVSKGKFDLAQAEAIVFTSKKLGRQHVKMHGVINPTGVGRGSNYLDIYLEEIIAPLQVVA